MQPAEFAARAPGGAERRAPGTVHYQLCHRQRLRQHDLAAGGSPTMAHDLREVEESVAGPRLWCSTWEPSGSWRPCSWPGKRPTPLESPWYWTGGRRSHHAAAAGLPPPAGGAWLCRHPRQCFRDPLPGPGAAGRQRGGRIRRGRRYPTNAAPSGRADRTPGPAHRGGDRPLRRYRHRLRRAQDPAAP